MELALSSRRLHIITTIAPFSFNFGSLYLIRGEEHFEHFRLGDGLISGDVSLVVLMINGECVIRQLYT